MNRSTGRFRPSEISLARAIVDQDSKTETRTNTPNSTEEDAGSDLGQKLIGPITRLIVLALVVTTLISLVSPHHWFADLLANLRMQQLIGLLVAFGLCLWVGNRRLACLAIILIAIHAPSFRSALPPPTTDTTPSSITVTFANTLTSNWSVDTIATDLVRNDPDVIAVLELSSILQAKLAKELSSAYPHSIARPLDHSNFGIGLYSKHPLHDRDVFPLNLEIESIAVTVSIADQNYRILATHPLPPMGATGFRHRNEHLQQLADRINTFQSKSPETHVILVGDLNLTPWSPIFSDLEKHSGLRQARSGFSVKPTWYRFPLFPFGLMLDHGLISKNMHCISHQVGPDIGSDHRSVTLELCAESK
jgi:endonuclease/exonuclease/phosphatase (EEP) superfamily protein YafD